jgi:ketosteroid isomerase-like protein
MQNTTINPGPVQEPITGAEEIGDLSQPLQALIQFYKAFNSRDLDLIDANFSIADEVVIANPVGGIQRGQQQPHTMYEKIFKSPADVRVEFWDYTIDRIDGVFLTVGRERGTYASGGERKDLAIRTSRIFRLCDGKWRQIHHHGSIDNPEMLASFKQAFGSA